MVKNFWLLFHVTLIGVIACITIFILAFVFRKNIIEYAKYGKAMLIVILCTAVVVGTLSAYKFSLCYKDCTYVLSNTYIEETATMVEFTKIKFSDTTGRWYYRNPKFYILDKNEYVILPITDVRQGATYIIRYYPNTKISEVVKDVTRS